eukprot:5762614-Pyramimonas_sp.AAC.1
MIPFARTRITRASVSALFFLKKMCVCSSTEARPADCEFRCRELMFSAVAFNASPSCNDAS